MMSNKNVAESSVCMVGKALEEKDIQLILEGCIDYLSEKFGVDKIAIFGSYVRGEQRKDSDVDLIVDFREGWKTFDNYMDLKFYLEEILDKKVDLVIKSSIRSRLEPFIIEEAIFLKREKPYLQEVRQFIVIHSLGIFLQATGQ